MACCFIRIWTFDSCIKYLGKWAKKVFFGDASLIKLKSEKKNLKEFIIALYILLLLYLGVIILEWERVDKYHCKCAYYVKLGLFEQIQGLGLIKAV